MTSSECSSPAIGVVFVNFHSERLIRPLAELYSGCGFRVVVADNSGTYPANAAGLRVPTGGNVGFGAGCNRAVEQLAHDVEVICLHNPDVEACVSTVVSSAAALRDQGRPGLVAPAEAVGAIVRETGYHYPTVARELVLAATTRMRKPGARSCPPRRPRGRRFAGAGLLLCSREAWRAVGGFDEEYFLYAEDLDLWHRIGRAGFECQFLPRAAFHHRMSQGSPMAADDRELLRRLGVELFAAKHSLLGWRPYRAAHRLFLRRLPAPRSLVAEEIDTAWRRGLDPSSTMELVRSRVGRGTGPSRGPR